MKKLKKKLNWTTFLWLVATHLMAVVAVCYLIFYRFDWRTVLLSVVFFVVVGESIAAGYHRLFCHGAYKAHALYRFCCLFFAAAAYQNSAIRWTSDHRTHHKYTDTKKDPHNFKLGFWHAHIGWLIWRREQNLNNVGDLFDDPLVRMQHRYYYLLAVLTAFGLPVLICSWWGDPLGGFLVGGFLRLMLQYHATFSVNSFAHWIGERPYSRAISAVDNLMVAVITFGEGYHNFHHHFQRDYRNGIRWYQWDPSKWLIRFSSLFRLTRELNRTPEEQILAARARVS